jgi:hypothetical protein
LDWRGLHNPPHHKDLIVGISKIFLGMSIENKEKMMIVQMVPTPLFIFMFLLFENKNNHSESC